MSRKPKSVRYLKFLPSYSNDVRTYRLRVGLSPSSINYCYAYYDIGLGRFHPPTGKLKFDLYKVEGLSDFPRGIYDVGVTAVDFKGNESDFRYKYSVSFDFKTLKCRVLYTLYSVFGITV